jgi:hypothetical protein
MPVMGRVGELGGKPPRRITTPTPTKEMITNDSPKIALFNISAIIVRA